MDIQDELAFSGAEGIVKIPVYDTLICTPFIHFTHFPALFCNCAILYPFRETTD